MAIDPTIALRVNPVQIENPLDTYAKVAQFKQMLQQNRLADLMFGEKERATQEEAATNRLWQSFVKPNGDVDQSGFIGALAQNNLGGKIPTYQKTFAEQAKARGDLDKQKIELVDSKLKQSRAFLENITTPEQYIAWHEGNHKDPILGPELASRGVTADQARASIAKALQEPGGFERLLKQSQLGLEKFSELYKPQIDTRNLGGTTETRVIDPLTGAVKVTNSAVNTQSPDNKASVSASMANAAATREVASATRDAAKISAESKRVQDTELKLQDDYRTESKGFSETSTAMKKVLGSIDVADKNPGAALAAGTAFMKLLDPNSVVRESELGMALNASGWFDRAMNIANTLQAGKVMTPKQKENLRKASETLFEEAKAAQREVDAAYEQRAKAYGLEPTRIIVDRGQRGSGTSAAAATGGLTAAEQKELAELRQRLGRPKQ